MLTYREFGKGPAVVLLHGFPLSGVIWDDQARHLAGQYRVVLPDLPGHGGSAPLADVSIAQMASEVLRLLDHLQVERAAVAGHSMGGYVALALQKQAPERVAGLALVCTQAGSDAPETREGRFATARKVESEGPQVLAAAMLPKLFASAEGPERMREAVGNLIRQTPVAGIKGALHAMADREDLQPLLPAMAVPTLILTGLEDRVIPPARSESMAAQIPGAVLVKVADAGHMPMMEQPYSVSIALERWLGLAY